MYTDKAKSAIGLTSAIIDAYGPRLAGSAACARAAEFILEKARAVSDTSAIENFSVHPGAFLGFIKVLVVMYAIAAAALAAAPAVWPS